LTLLETFQFLKSCHRNAPFLFFNGNTFAEIGRTLATALFSDLPLHRRKEASSAVAHFITGVLDQELMIAAVDSLWEAANFKASDRVQALRGSTPRDSEAPGRRWACRLATRWDGVRVAGTAREFVAGKGPARMKLQSDFVRAEGDDFPKLWPMKDHRVYRWSLVLFSLLTFILPVDAQAPRAATATRHSLWKVEGSATRSIY